MDGAITSFVYDGVNIVQELTGIASNNSDPSTVRASYISGGIDEVFAQTSGAGTTAQTLTYLSDALGSTIQLANSAGVKVVSYSYDPYGNTTADANVYNPFQYTGRENDETGLYYYRARYYSPNLARFISSDPIGLAGGVNTYAYVEGNPISLVDPFGLYCLSERAIGAIGGAAGGAFAGAVAGLQAGNIPAAISLGGLGLTLGGVTGYMGSGTAISAINGGGAVAAVSTTNILSGAVGGMVGGLITYDLQAGGLSDTQATMAGGAVGGALGGAISGWLSSTALSGALGGGLAGLSGAALGSAIVEALRAGNDCGCKR